MKDILKKILPTNIVRRLEALKRYFNVGFSVSSFSQEGEDMVLNRLFLGKSNGFFVDVGAHHPKRFSNTYFFYKRGWCGINIEPNPDMIRIFKKARRKDINLQLGVSKKPGHITYYQFDEPALNTFDGDVVKSRLKNTEYKLQSTTKVEVLTLDQVLSDHLPDNTQIDFLSVDVEGFDLEVLESNNWNRYRPYCVLVEALDMSMEEILRGDIVKLMKKQKYVLYAKTNNTLFFLNE